MKLFIISGIHGSIEYLNCALEQFEKEKADLLVILGDILYHGPRNPLPQGYAPAEVVKRINPYKDKVLAVRGNCDSEVDQMVLDFEMMGDYHILVMENYKIFLTHGHLYHTDKLPNLQKGDVLLHGHSHVPMAQDIEGIICLNPGSITLPKQESKRSYGIIENSVFKVFTLEGELILERSLK